MCVCSLFCSVIRVGGWREGQHFQTLPHIVRRVSHCVCHHLPPLFRFSPCPVSFILNSCSSLPASCLHRLLDPPNRLSLHSLLPLYSLFPSFCSIFSISLPLSHCSALLPLSAQVLCGEVLTDNVEQVKGVTYSVSQFLGEEYTAILARLGRAPTVAFPPVHVTATSALSASSFAATATTTTTTTTAGDDKAKEQVRWEGGHTRE